MLPYDVSLTWSSPLVGADDGLVAFPEYSRRYPCPRDLADRSIMAVIDDAGPKREGHDPEVSSILWLHLRLSIACIQFCMILKKFRVNLTVVIG
jgi:hypothetical protein